MARCRWLALLTLALAASAQAPRDVLATGHLHPFLTSADLGARLDDTRAEVSGGGGPTVFVYPGIEAVLVGDRPAPVAARGPGWLVAQMPAGTHAVSVQAPAARDATLFQAPPPSPDAATPDTFAERAGALQPGDTLTLANGVYDDWRMEVKASGTADRPIVIEAQTPGGVVLRGTSGIRLAGSHLVLKGLRFEHAGPELAVLVSGSDNRVTQCQFWHCGNPSSTFSHIVRVDMGAHRNRVDHCYFTGSLSMSLAQRVSAGGELGLDNRFDHNVFRDIYRYWINGQENVQVGQNQRGETGARRPGITVELNLFDHAWGDSEIISNKSSGNLYRWNVAAHCYRSTLTLRGGDEAVVDGNVFWDNDGAIRVMGTRHTIINNLVFGEPAPAIYFETGHADGESNVASVDTLVAHNTIVDCNRAVAAMPTTDERPHAPRDNVVVNNLVADSFREPFDLTHLVDTTLERNLVTELTPGVSLTALAGRPDEPVIAALAPGAAPVDGALPLPTVGHDRWMRLRPAGGGPDIGADEIDAPLPADPPRLFAVPPTPRVEPDLYKLDTLAEGSAAELLGRDGADGWVTLSDESARLPVESPGDFVMAWRYRPTAFSAAAAVEWMTDAGVGLRLSWGGVDGEGLPAGIMRLERLGPDRLLAAGPDPVYLRQDFTDKGWPGVRRYQGDAPDPNRVYDFVVVKRGERLWVAVDRGRWLPILIWDQRGQPTDPGRATVSLRQIGAGQWGPIGLWRYGYVGDAQPPAPVDLAAEPFGGGRVRLTWRPGEPRQAGLRYEVRRADRGAPATLATGVPGGGYDDVQVQPSTAYRYEVRAVNAAGRASEPAAVEVASGEGGAVYRVLEAEDADPVSPPIARAEDADGTRYVWTPSGSGAWMNGPPSEGGAEYAFEIDAPGRYMLWGRVIAPDNSSDSFYVQLDRPRDAESATWYTGEHLTWTWSRIGGPVQLNAGEHLLRVLPRESGTKLDRILLTTDLEIDLARPQP